MKPIVVWLLLALPVLAFAQSGAPADATIDAKTDAPVAAPVDAAVAAPADAKVAPADAAVAAPVQAPVPAPVTTPPPKLAHPAIPKKADKPAAAEPAENKTKVSSLFAIKVIGGLAALLVLAYLGGNRRVDGRSRSKSCATARMW